MRGKRLHQWGLFILIAATFYAAVGLWLRAWFEVSSGILDSDALLFQTVGRGIARGLTPYTDLFETKPPAVFLLSAVSWSVFGSQVLVKLTQAVVLLGIPFVVSVPAISMVEHRPATERRFISSTSILFGVLLALYTANQAGLGLAESYGAFFAILFLAVFARSSRPRPLYFDALGILLLCAVGFKEPFVLSILAGVIVLSRNWKSSAISFSFAVFVAGVLGIGALFALGYIDAFFGVYLPHMLGFHVHQHDGSTLLRALEVWRVFTNIGAYSWSFAAALSVLVFGMAFRMHIVRWIVAVYLMLLSIAVGGDFYGHHFIFAVPVYAALFWLGVQYRWKRPIVIAFVMLLVSTSLIDTRLSYADSADAWKLQEKQMITAASQIDTLMDTCGWERYLQMIPREEGPYAFMRHSPYGPIFIHYDRFIGASKQYQTAYIKALQEAPFMLLLDLENSNLSQFALQYVGVHFDVSPPPCAGEDFVQPAPYTLLFRQD